MEFKYKYSSFIEQNDILNIKILELMIKKDLKPLVIFFGNKNRWLKRKEVDVGDDEGEKKGKSNIDDDYIISTEYMNNLKDQLEEKINKFIDKKLAENYYIFNKKIGNTYFIEYALSYFPYPYVIQQLMEHYISIIPKNIHKFKGIKKNLVKEKVLLNSIKSSNNIFFKEENDNGIWRGSLQDTYLLNSGPIENQRENYKKKERLFQGKSMANFIHLITEEEEEEEEDNDNFGNLEINVDTIGEDFNRTFSVFEDNDDFVSPFLRSNFYEIKLWQSEAKVYDENKNVIPIIDFKYKHSQSLENVQNLRNNRNESLLGLAFKKKLPLSIIEILLKYSVSTGVQPRNIGLAKDVRNTTTYEDYGHNLLKKSRHHINANYLIYACKDDTHGNKNELVKLLLRYNINPNSQDEFGKTALMYAIENDDIEKIKMLLNYIHITADLILGLIFFGRSRSRVKNKDLVRYIEICGGKTDISIKDNYKKSAFDYACIYKKENIIKILLLYTINRNKLRKEYNNYSYSNINIRNSIFLRRSSFSNFNLKSCNNFKNGSNLNFNNNLKAYHNYMSLNSTNHLKDNAGIYNSSNYLKESGNFNSSSSDVHNSNIKGLNRYNSSNNNKSIYELNKSTISSSINSFAEKMKCSETDRTMNYSNSNLTYKSYINVEYDDNNMFFPISNESIKNLVMLSISRNYIDILNILLKNGLSPDITDDEGNNLLLILATKYNKEKNEKYYNIMKLLLQYNAKIDIPNINNMTVFKEAIYHSKKLINLLLNCHNNIGNQMSNSKSVNNVDVLNNDDNNLNIENNENVDNIFNEKYNIIEEQSDDGSESEGTENLLKNDANDLVSTEKINSSSVNITVPKVVIKKIATLIKDKYNKEMILYLAIWYENINIINNKLIEWSRHQFSFDLDIALILVVLKNNEKIESLLFNNISLELIESKNGQWKVLHYLCEIDTYHERVINFLLDNNADLNYKSSENETPLEIAVKNKNFKMIKFLIEHNVDIPKVFENYEPFFISVCQSNNIDIVTYVLDNVKSMNIYELDEYDNNALMISCKFGYVDIVKHLLKYQFNINDEDVYGNTALILACQNGNLDVVKLLINENTLVDKTLDKSLSSINYSNNYDDVNSNNVTINNEQNILTDHLYESDSDNHDNFSSFNNDSHKNSFNGIKINKKNNRGMTAFVMSCQHGNLEMIQYLLRYIGNIDDKCHDGSTGLMVACYNNKEHIIQYLLDQGADPNEQDSTGNNSLIYACQMGNTNVVNLLLERSNKVDINMTNRNRNTALMYACQHGYEDIVKKLLEYHADINIKDINQNTALLYSIRNEFQDISILLIEHGADVNCIESENKSTALMIACQTKQYMVVKALLEKGAELNIQNKYNYCPLLIAIENNDEVLVEILLQFNADINAYDTYGNNSLMLACLMGNEKIVELLLNYQQFSLDINVKNSLNNTALHNACENGNYNIVKMLLSHNASVNNLNNNGLSELAIAGQNNEYEIVKLLLAEHALLNIENYLMINHRGYYTVGKLILDANAIS